MTSETNKTDAEDKAAPNVKTKKNGTGIHWIFWWMTGEGELDKQVKEYSTLKITESARGISAILLLLSVVVTTIAALALGHASALVDAGMFLVLAFFIYHGFEWAMIGAMLLWTFEKGYSLFSTGWLHSNSVIAVFWWAIYMHAFWLAYLTEKERAKIRVAKSKALPQ